MKNLKLELEFVGGFGGSGESVTSFEEALVQIGEGDNLMFDYDGERWIRVTRSGGELRYESNAGNWSDEGASPLLGDEKIAEVERWMTEQGDAVDLSDYAWVVHPMA